MSVEKIAFSTPSSDGVHALKGVVYRPTGHPKALFHVVHGMSEYIGRYDAFMTTMAENGFLVFGYDHLGHGQTALDRSELGYVPAGGWDFWCRDVKVFADAVRAEFVSGDADNMADRLPYYLMGHSMGSFIVRLAAVRVLRPDKLIIMGTGGPNPAVSAGITLARLVCRLKGEHHRSKLLQTLSLGSFCKKFPKDCPVHWLTKDAAVKEAYMNDPFCGYRFTAAAMLNLFILNRDCNRREALAQLASFGPALPILLVSGADDPVGDFTKGVRTVYDTLKANGANVQMKLYPNCRHELLNEDCREECASDICDFLNS